MEDNSWEVESVKVKSLNETILGYLDGRIKASDDNDKFTTKTGGRPVYN